MDWSPAQPLQPVVLNGARVSLRPVAIEDAEALFEAGRDPGIWTYLAYGPYSHVDEMRSRVAEMQAATDTLFFAIWVDGIPQGIASYLRIDPEQGSIEIGHIWFGTSLQRTTAATEAIYLLMRHAFDHLGHRRLEWRCNALNAKSRRAAERFGFTFEGVFRNHMVVKGRNRDTAWYAITVEDWPAIRAAYDRWLDPSNFDQDGRQLTPLQAPATSGTSSATDSTMRDGLNG